MITPILEEIKNIVSPSCQNLKTTRFDFFVPEAYPAVCVEPDEIVEDAEVLQYNKMEFSFTINVYYLETIESLDNDMSLFISNVESLLTTLRGHPTLNGKCVTFTTSVKFLDNTYEDNYEFIAVIQIVGRTR